MRASFGAERNVLNFSLPRSWGELNEQELSMVFRCKVRNEDPWQQKLAVLMHLTGLVVERREGESCRCCVPTNEGRLHFSLDAELLSSLLEGLTWLDDPGNVPARPHRLHGVQALQPQLHGVPFGTYLQCENCYQGVLSNQSEDAVAHLARLLYPGLQGRLAMWEQLAVIQWWAQLKAMFAALFGFLFKPCNADATTVDPSVAMNNQIRALTGGDVTKEDTILSTDTWRALTELDAKAREADELNRKLKK